MNLIQIYATYATNFDISRQLIYPLINFEKENFRFETPQLYNKTLSFPLTIKVNIYPVGSMKKRVFLSTLLHFLFIYLYKVVAQWLDYHWVRVLGPLRVLRVDSWLTQIHEWRTPHSIN